jgi:hypothetical protein
MDSLPCGLHERDGELWCEGVRLSEIGEAVTIDELMAAEEQ